MSEITYETSDKYVYIMFPETCKDKYINLLKQVGAKWSVKKNAYAIRHEKESLFKRLVTLSYPVVEESSDDDEEETTVNPDRRLQHKFKRAISEDEYSDDDSVENKLVDNQDNMSVSSSNSSQSSDDYPIASPSRKKFFNDTTAEKLAKMQDKLYQMSINKKIKSKGNI